MDEVWTKWQGRVINGAFPLQRYLGCSDHSAVFLTAPATRDPAEAAVKLIPAIPTLTVGQLSDWNRVASLAHPHLIRLFEAGPCELDGLPFFYIVMEYGDQTLAQLLKHRALTEVEVLEMLPPTLNALAFLHARNLVHGQLKPANVLAVGDQLKISSDSIRSVTEAGASRHTLSAYDPPEARGGSYSAAGDVWALGVSLFEALTGSPPPRLDDRRINLTLPQDFSPKFREIVARCLNRGPSDRPRVAEIEAWVRSQSMAIPESAGDEQPAAAALPTTPEPAPPQPEREKVSEAPDSEFADEAAKPPAVGSVPSPEAARRQALRWQSPVPLLLGAIAILGVIWVGMRALSIHRNATTAVVEGPRDGRARIPSEGAEGASGQASPDSSISGTKPAAEAAGLGSALHEEIPAVPASALQTIHGHIRVGVRVMVDKEGTVYAAIVDQPGPSRYFERVAIEAAKKWTFPPSEEEATRLKLIRFEFTRQGAKGHAVTPS